MTHRTAFRIGAVLLTLTVGCVAARKQGPAAPRAPLFDDLGSYHHPITTDSAEAQRYFDQGLTLAYGFNHREAARSFRQAAALDPACAMCWWGVALVLGPNINTAMDAGDVPEAWEASRKALAAGAHASPRERAYVEALAKRYAAAPPADRTPLDQAYADAMREVARQYPDDFDATALASEALMDLHPWDFWLRDGSAQPWTPEILALLESVLRRDPSHIGATHFYIHAIEASKDPGRAAPYADHLGGLVPGAGHLVHMPAHIYIRVGRYHDAVLANVRATAADNSYVTQCRAQGVYPLVYVPHNHHFLAAAATLEGWSTKAIEAALGTEAKTNHELMGEPGMGALQHYSIIPLYVYVRFGRWDEILARPAPPPQLLYPTGVWHYARGRALAAKGQLAAAEKELAALREVETNGELEKVTIWDVNSTASVLRVAEHDLAGDLAFRKGDTAGAIRLLREGVRLEDALRYQEPSDWMNPVRLSLGAVLLTAGRAREAETVYRADLAIYPENGWALFGLARALEAQHKRAEAARVQERFARAWQHADVHLTSSRF
jgi:tetratricopeptide (TPR) repeat protein